ncbi:MAG TPA: dTDP-4-dehydrorhamnose reductase [Dokdonella sp.]|uniref:dTDP-4-dehydrorhamnose reductase n=1 Tax=Dokdonella sp. TaxID=2291710 RepID=UPI002D807ACC|nr:dTDP-4-dehydrorhamnose reductase [Dokdonella sp.]HET9032739.1 dTDP-4-dehydrorhamnose reductase [Dokdonella sp.]
MNILLFGANGQVGFALREPLAELGRLICATRSGALDDDGPCVSVDLADSRSLANALDASGAKIIVNAAAYTAVDRAEDETDLADRVNHRAVAEMGEWAARNEALVIHYSTDYVFDGNSERPWHENDATAPLGVYGRSKLAGEQALRDSGAQHLILRTAWVYAARGQNFLRTMLRVAAEREELRVVDDQVGAPTSAGWIARTTANVLRRWLAMGVQEREMALGTYHLTASLRCSWFGFADQIMREAHDAGLHEKIPRMIPITSADYPTRATRPAFSVLDNAKLTLVFGQQQQPWQEGLHEVIGELAATRSHGDVS